MNLKKDHLGQEIRKEPIEYMRIYLQEKLKLAIGERIQDIKFRLKHEGAHKDTFRKELNKIQGSKQPSRVKKPSEGNCEA